MVLRAETFPRFLGRPRAFHTFPAAISSVLFWCCPIVRTLLDRLSACFLAIRASPTLLARCFRRVVLIDCKSVEDFFASKRSLLEATAFDSMQKSAEFLCSSLQAKPVY